MLEKSVFITIVMFKLAHRNRNHKLYFKLPPFRFYFILYYALFRHKLLRVICPVNNEAKVTITLVNETLRNWWLGQSWLTALIWKNSTAN